MDRRIYDTYVIQLAQDRGLTTAAEHLGISQPALSAGITLLEKELGIKLFNRRSKPITMTPEGGLYLEHLNKVQVLTDDFWKRLDAYRADANCHVAIGGSVVYAETLIADAVACLLRDRPEYTVSVCCAPLDELIEKTANGELNCFISTSEEIPDRFVREYVKTERLFLCVPENMPVNKALQSAEAPARYGALSDCDFIFLEDGQPLQARLRSFFKAYGITPRQHAVTNQVSAAISMAKQGIGVCLASEDALRNAATNDGSLRTYELPEAFAARRIYAAYTKDLFFPTACRDLLDRLITLQETTTQED